MNQKKKNQIQKAKPRKVQVKKNPDIVKITKQQFFILFCMLVAVFIAYLPALHNDFINLDDIRQNSFISNFSFSKILLVFGHFYKEQYAPFPFAIYGIINMITGFQPFLYNIVSVVLHLITILLVFKFIGIGV